MWEGKTTAVSKKPRRHCRGNLWHGRVVTDARSGAAALTNGKEAAPETGRTVAFGFTENDALQLRPVPA